MTPAARTAAIMLAVALVAAALILWGTGALAASTIGSAAYVRLGAAGSELLFTLLLFGPLIAVAIIGLHYGHDRLAIGPRGTAIGIGLAIGVGGLVLTLFDARLAGMVRHAAPPTGGIALILLGTVATLFQSTAEEVYFRGWLQPALIRGWGVAAGIGVSALAFAALHIMGGARSPVSLLNLFLGGLLFGLLAWRTGGILAPAAAHAGWNWAEGMLFGLDPNPGIGSYGALVDLDLVGRPLWGGSPEGLNASIAMSIVLVALLLPLLAWRTGPAASPALSPTGSPG